MKRAFAIWLSLAAWAIAVALCVCAQGQVVAGDWSVDNGPIITRLLADEAAGAHPGPVELPGGTINVSSTIRMPNACGCAITGSGGIAYLMCDNHFGSSPSAWGGRAATRLVWTGEPGGTVLEVNGWGHRIANLTIQGQRMPGWGPVKLDPDKQAAVGIAVEGTRRPGSGELPLPAGKHRFENVCLLACDVAVLCEGYDHCDQLTWEHLITSYCPTVYRVTGTQSVGHVITHLAVLTNCERVFDFRQGGELSARGVSMIGGTLLRLGQPNWNVGSYRIADAWVDNNAKQFRALEMTKPGDAFVEIDAEADGRVNVRPAIVKDGGQVCIQIKQVK